MTTSTERKTLKLEITGRHIKVTPALRTFARQKLTKIRRLVDGPLEVHVILTVEKHRHVTEIVAHGRQLKLSAREVTQDMYTSIGECVEKLEVQTRKHKEKFSTRRRRATTPAAEEEAPAPNRSGRASTSKMKTAASPGRKRNTVAANLDGEPGIVRTALSRRKPMSVEEAALEIEDTDQGFIVFRNDRSQEINVLYQRKDGKLGLIEPES